MIVSGCSGCIQSTCVSLYLANNEKWLLLLMMSGWFSSQCKFIGFFYFMSSEVCHLVFPGLPGDFVVGWTLSIIPTKGENECK